MYIGLLVFFLIFISTIVVFCFVLFHPCDVLKLLLGAFDFRAAEINTEHIEDPIV